MTQSSESGGVTPERAVLVCPQCEGEGGYADGLDDAACHTDCTRCGGNGWIVDVQASGIAELTAENERLREALTFLEEQARRSQTGISFDWVPSFGGQPSGFRFMRRHHVGDPTKTLLGAIEKVRAALSNQESK